MAYPPTAYRVSMKMYVGLAAVAALLMLAPLVAADGEKSNETTSDEGRQAWVDDCPEDMMCAMGGQPEEQPEDGVTRGPEGCEYCRGGSDEPTYDGNCGGEVCAYGADDPDAPDSNEGGGPVGSGSTCMDGEQEGEVCRDDVQYLDGREPSSSDPMYESAPATGDNADDARRTVPGFGLGAAVAALGALALVAARRR